MAVFGETDNPSSLLLKETFDGDLSRGPAAALLADRHITLAEKAGPDGTDAIRVAYVGYERGSERVVVRIPLQRGVEKATLRFDVRFEEDFQWTLGGKLHGLGPLAPVTGGDQRVPDGWSARIMFKSKGGCATYLYDQDTERKWGMGDQSDGPVFRAGQWHRVALAVSLNEPGKANGLATVSVDAREVVRTEGVVFRKGDGERTFIQKLLFSTFHGGNKPRWTPVNQKGDIITVYALFDNFQVTEES